MLRIDPNKVRGYLGFAGMNVTELADAVGVTRATMYNIMGGGNTDLNTVSSIAKALGVNPLDILAVDEEPPPHVDAPAGVAAEA